MYARKRAGDNQKRPPQAHKQFHVLPSFAYE